VRPVQEGGVPSDAMPEPTSISFLPRSSSAANEHPQGTPRRGQRTEGLTASAPTVAVAAA